MELVPGNDSVTIRDKGDGVMTFPLISATPTAADPVTDKVLISTIADALGNTITVTSTGMKITQIEDGSGLPGDPPTPGRITYFDYDSVSGLLAAIRTPWQGSSDCVRFSYTNGASEPSMMSLRRVLESSIEMTFFSRWTSSKAFRSSPAMPRP